MDVYALCFRVLGHSQDAEDATQETFLALFREREKMARAASVKAWVTAVARNTAISVYRARRRKGGLLEEAVEAPPVEDPVDRHRLDEAMAGLTEEERHLIRLRFVDQKGPDEMAETAGKSRGAIATALCRALGRLRALYHGGAR